MVTSLGLSASASSMAVAIGVLEGWMPCWRCRLHAPPSARHRPRQHGVEAAVWMPARSLGGGCFAGQQVDDMRGDERDDSGGLCRLLTISFHGDDAGSAKAGEQRNATCR